MNESVSMHPARMRSASGRQDADRNALVGRGETHRIVRIERRKLIDLWIVGGATAVRERVGYDQEVAHSAIEAVRGVSDQIDAVAGLQPALFDLSLVEEYDFALIVDAAV